MAAVEKLEDGKRACGLLAEIGYVLAETGMPRRFFLRKRDKFIGCDFHLHIVELATWAERKERLMRDYLRLHPGIAEEYERLKRKLAAERGEDLEGYTMGKTAFIQGVIERVRESLGLPRIEVWES